MSSAPGQLEGLLSTGWPSRGTTTINDATMRAVSFVCKLEFEVQGNVMKDAIALGDVDNDKGNELAVGNINGELFIFKGTCHRAWKTGSDLGMITSVVIGDIMNEGKNMLVTVSGEGWCHIFDVTSPGVQDDLSPADDRRRLRATHKQRLPANTKMALLANIDQDDSTQLVLGLTDRVVRSYRWNPAHQDASGKTSGMLIAQNKWEFASQIGSISLHHDAEGVSCILVSQPGGTYARLNCNNATCAQQEVAAQTEKSDPLPVISLNYHPLTSAKMRNPNIATEILGDIGQGDDGAHLFAVATLDGTLMLVNNEAILWSLQVDHQLFGLAKLDVTGDGREEVVVSSWDGQTYIVNHQRQSLRFQFEDGVNSFLAGYYSICPSENVPCFVYATFFNRLCLFHDVQVAQIATTNLTDALSQKPNASLEKLLEQLGINADDEKEVRRITNWCLYGFPTHQRRIQNKLSSQMSQSASTPITGSSNTRTSPTLSASSPLPL